MLRFVEISDAVDKCNAWHNTEIFRKRLITYDRRYHWATYPVCELVLMPLIAMSSSAAHTETGSGRILVINCKSVSGGRPRHECRLWALYTVIRQKVCLNRIILLCDINLNVNERRGHAATLTSPDARAHVLTPPSPTDLDKCLQKQQ